jgi:hypothetical protein
MRRLEKRIENLEHRLIGVQPGIVITVLSPTAGELKGYLCGSGYIARQRGEDEATFKSRAQALAGQGAVLAVLKEDRS